MNLRARALGLSLGVIWGLTVCAATTWALFRGRGATLQTLGGYYLGYTVSYPGALIGLAWGFVSGFVWGVLIALFYNLFFGMLYKSSDSAR